MYLALSWISIPLIFFHLMLIADLVLSNFHVSYTVLLYVKFGVVTNRAEGMRSFLRNINGAVPLILAYSVEH